MAKYRCNKCGVGRNLRTDGIVEACTACGAVEQDAFREAIEVIGEPEFTDDIEQS